MDYAKALAQGRILLVRLDQTQWEMARLTYQVVQAGGRGTLTVWANDLGISLSLASNLNAAWEAFGNLYDRKELGGRSFNDCVVEARASAERAARLRREAEESGRGMGTVDHRIPGRDGERERRRDFQRRLRDPEAVRQAIRGDRATRQALRKVFEEEFIPAPAAPSPPPATKSPGRLVQPLIQNLEAVRDRLNRTLIRMIKTKLTRQDRTRLDEVLDQIENSVDWTRSFLDSGNTSFEEMLQQLVTKGAPEDDPAAPAEPPPPPRRRVAVTNPDAAELAAEASPASEETVAESGRSGEHRPAPQRGVRARHDRRTRAPSG